MGDRERERPVGGVRLPSDSHVSTVPSPNSSFSLVSSSNGILEEERWLLGEGIIHGELRDEIYCQLMKQLTGNPNPCVLPRRFLCPNLRIAAKAYSKDGNCYVFC